MMSEYLRVEFAFSLRTERKLLLTCQVYLQDQNTGLVIVYVSAGVIIIIMEIYAAPKL